MFLIMIKKIIKYALSKKNLEIRRKYNGFCLNDNISWIINKNVKTILDIGANDGQFALFARKMFSDSVIFSFEPLLTCFTKVLEISNNDKNMVALNFALGENNETVEMFHDKFSPSSSLLKMTNEHIQNFPYTGNQIKELVKLRKLDTLDEVKDVEREVLMKIDVQGYELNVLKGATNFINQYLPLIVLEISFADLYENEPAFEEIYDFMRALDYRFTGTLDQLYSPDDGAILQADVIFEKNNR